MTGNVRGDMAINFSCAPENAGRLVDLALDEVEALQSAGPSAKEVIKRKGLPVGIFQFMAAHDSTSEGMTRTHCR